MIKHMDIIVTDGVMVFRDQEQYGPYGIQDVVAWWQSGDLDDHDLLWMDGMDDWIAIQPFFESNTQLLNVSADEDSGEEDYVEEKVIEARQESFLSDLIEARDTEPLAIDDYVYQAVQRIEINMEHLQAGMSAVYQSVEALRNEVAELKSGSRVQHQEPEEKVHEVQMKDTSFSGATDVY